MSPSQRHSTETGSGFDSLSLYLSLFMQFDIKKGAVHSFRLSIGGFFTAPSVLFPGAFGEQHHDRQYFQTSRQHVEDHDDL